VFLLEPQRTQYDLNFRLFGIPVRIHPMFWLMSLVMGWNAIQLGFEFVLLWVGCVFLSILIHELGHVLMGMLFGYWGHIILYGFGGLAVGSNAMPNRWQRIAVSFAGPLAGFVYLAVLLGALYLKDPERVEIAVLESKAMLHLQSDTDQARAAELRPRRVLMWQHPTLLDFGVSYMVWINLFWGVFNLLPIWPLDGGQISRDLCGWISPRNGQIVSLGISFLLAALLAVQAIMASRGQPLLPFLPISGMWATILFALLAIESFHLLQQAQAERGRWEYPDD
jgi:Zn-dependent protease